MKIKGNILFREQQQFRIKWLWWLIIISMLSSIGITLGIAISEKEKPKEAWIALAVAIPFEALIAYLMYITILETVVSSEGIYYRWAPFRRSYRFIPWQEIENIELRNGPSLSYGYHWVIGYGKVHNVGPGKGFQLILKNGKKIFIGSQKQSAFQTAIDKMRGVPMKA